MAIYYDYAMNHIQPSSTALDPNTDYFVWLYDKLSDWANKTNGAVQMVTGPPEWQASPQWPASWSNTAPAYVTVKLNGTSYATGDAQAVNDSHNILSLRSTGYSSAANQVVKIQKPQLIDESLGWNDPSNYTRSSWGSISGTSGYQDQNLGYANYKHRPSDYVLPRTSHVLYSDKPGDEWFYWWFRENTATEGLQGHIFRVTPPDDYPSKFDPGWACSMGANVYNLMSVHDLQDPSSSWTYDRGSVVATSIIPSNRVGRSDAVGGGYYPLLRGLALRDNFGALYATRDDYLTSPLSLQPLATYEVKGTKYVCVMENLLLPYEDFV